MYNFKNILTKSLTSFVRSRAYSNIYHNTAYCYTAKAINYEHYTKVYKINGEGTFENKEPKFIMKGASATDQSNAAPLEQLLCALCGCEYTTALFLARNEFKININKLNFKNVEGHINTSALFGKGDLNQNRFAKIIMDVEIESEATQYEIDDLKNAVAQRCPIHNMLTLAGVQIETNWKRVD